MARMGITSSLSLTVDKGNLTLESTLAAVLGCRKPGTARINDANWKVLTAPENEKDLVRIWNEVCRVGGQQVPAVHSFVLERTTLKITYIDHWSYDRDPEGEPEPMRTGYLAHLTPSQQSQACAMLICAINGIELSSRSYDEPQERLRLYFMQKMQLNA